MNDLSQKKPFGKRVKKIFKIKTRKQGGEVLSTGDGETLRSEALQQEESVRLQVIHNRHLSVIKERRKLMEEFEMMLYERKQLNDEKNNIIQDKRELFEEKTILLQEKERYFVKVKTVDDKYNVRLNETVSIEEFEQMKKREQQLEMFQNKLKEQHDKLKNKKHELEEQVFIENEKLQNEKVELEKEKLSFKSFETEMVKKFEDQRSKYEELEKRYKHIQEEEDKIYNTKQAFEREKTRMLAHIDKQNKDLSNLQHLLGDASNELEEQISSFKQHERNMIQRWENVN